MDENIVALTSELERLTGRSVFLLVAPFFDRLPDIIYRSCCSTQRSFENERGVDVVLASHGGSADAAFRAVKLLRRYFQSFRVLITGDAWSAATLFALGAEEIHLGPMGCLGPLDVQILDPRNPLETMSALDGYQSVEYIRNFGLLTFDGYVQLVINRAPVRLPHATREAAEFAYHVVEPLLAQIGPLDFGGWGRALSIGAKYATTLLEMRGITNASQVAQELVFGYPHHGYIIDIEEVLRLGLKGVDMDARWAGVVERLTVVANA